MVGFGRIDGYNDDGTQDRMGVQGVASMEITFPDGSKRFQPLSDKEFIGLIPILAKMALYLLECSFSAVQDAKKGI